MKILEGLILTELGDDHMVVATGPAAEKIHGIIRLNNSALEIWKGIEAGWDTKKIAAGLVEKFDGVDLETAEKSTKETIEKLKKAGVIIE